MRQCTRVQTIKGGEIDRTSISGVYEPRMAATITQQYWAPILRFLPTVARTRKPYQLMKVLL